MPKQDPGNRLCWRVVADDLDCPLALLQEFFAVHNLAVLHDAPTSRNHVAHRQGIRLDDEEIRVASRGDLPFARQLENPGWVGRNEREHEIQRVAVRRHQPANLLREYVRRAGVRVRRGGAW
jgi:hypothetical protein